MTSQYRLPRVLSLVDGERDLDFVARRHHEGVERDDDVLGRSHGRDGIVRPSNSDTQVIGVLHQWNLLQQTEELRAVEVATQWPTASLRTAEIGVQVAI